MPKDLDLYFEPFNDDDLRRLTDEEIAAYCQPLSDEVLARLRISEDEMDVMFKPLGDKELDDWLKPFDGFPPVND